MQPSIYSIHTSQLLAILVSQRKYNKFSVLYINYCFYVIVYCCAVTPIPFVVITLGVRSEYYGVRDELTGELQLYVVSNVTAINSV